MGEPSTTTNVETVGGLNDNNGHVVKQGDNIILLLSDKKYFYDVHVGKKDFIKIGNNKVSVGSFIGLFYGSTYELSHGKLVPFNPKASINESLVIEEDEKRNNSLLVDNNKSQSMTQEQILELRREASGSDVIKALTENSTTFAQKTAFSQEKYIKKKQQKHLVTIKVIRPTAKSIATAYYDKNPSKIHYLRPDSLAYILSQANLHPNSTNLVIEDCVGVVTGSVLERLGGHAKVLSAYFRGSPPRLSFFNFSPQILNSVFYFHLSSTLALLNNSNNNNNNVGEGSSSSNGDNSVNNTQEQSDIQDSGSDKKRKREDIETNDTSPENKQPKSEGEASLNNETSMEITNTEQKSGISKEGENAKPSQNDITEMLKSGVDSLIVVAPQYTPTSLFEHVFPLLRPSGVFVVFSPSIQPLVDLHESLRGKAVNTNLSEIWFREYQVLPLRTHPTMSMDGSSGFILTGTRVINPPKSHPVSNSIQNSDKDKKPIRVKEDK
eukprot:TRINITY_DN698_c0_g3_i2.p1 TRINITY_DN698_c0_g3~~TRINITY_DN698_c0_g3_i2.p1  ORF type:complete len:495 (-),score=118.58 TRINITY_DN698_c0_g3_i2:42-1526(-)